MSFVRNLLPDPMMYFEAEGLTPQGRGKWRTTRCDFHDGSDSMRINVESGAWVCMACGVKGGDVLAYCMQRHGADFVTTAKTLGAWVDDGKPVRPQRKFSASDALGCIERELYVCSVVVGDARKGLLPSDADWQRFLSAAGTVIGIAQEARS